VSRLNQYRSWARGWPAFAEASARRRMTGAHRRRSARTGEPIESARAPLGCHATGRVGARAR